jgi:hypothetical protein
VRENGCSLGLPVRQYYYTITGEDVLGPVSEAQLYFMLGRGEIPALTQICAEGTGEWHKLESPEAGADKDLSSATRSDYTIATVDQKAELELSKDKTAIAQGGVLGVLGLLLFIAGLALCFTLIGGILGVPMVIAGVALMGWGPLLAIGKPKQKITLTLRGPCPYCDHQVTFDGPVPGYDCPACKNRFVVRENEFWRVDKNLRFAPIANDK